MGAAARKLGQSQPVISRKLQVFQTSAACGAILLRRQGQRLQLTEAGQAAVPAARDLVRRYDQLLEFLRGRQSEPTCLRLAAGSFTAQQYVPQLISVLRRKNTPVQVETRIARGRDRIVGVLEGKFDLAVVSHSPEAIDQIARSHVGRSGSLRVELLGKQCLCVTAGKATDAAEELEQTDPRQPVSLQQLHRWELVGLDRQSGLRRQLEQHITAPSDLHFLAEGGGWAAAKEFARQGIGVAIVPLLIMAPGDRKDFVVRRLGDEFQLKRFVVYRPDEPVSAMKLAIEALRVAVTADEEQARRRWNVPFGHKRGQA